MAKEISKNLISCRNILFSENSKVEVLFNLEKILLNIESIELFFAKK